MLRAMARTWFGSFSGWFGGWFGRSCLASAMMLVPSGVALAAVPGPVAEQDQAVPLEEYGIYDRVVIDKFLTSRTTLVVIQRMTTTRLAPFEEKSPDQAFFDVNQLFGGVLDRDLITDFVHKTKTPSRLESRFNLGVPYRFAVGDQLEGPEVSLVPVPAQSPPGPRPDGPPPIVGVLEFSRVGFNRREDQALVYVGVDRPDGTGAGLLFWFHRVGVVWQSVDGEVLWTK